MSYSPEGFILIADDLSLDSLEIRQLGTSAFGRSNDQYAFFDGVLLGRFLVSKDSDAIFGISLNGKFVVELVPMLRKPSIGEYSEALSFLVSLLKFLRANSGWTLVCEEFFDEGQFKELEFWASEAEGCISHAVLAYGRVLNSCPTFIVRNEI